MNDASVSHVAALFDIHGNLPALEAVLDEFRRLSVDEVIVGGDVFPGPMPMAVLERLNRLEMPVRFIRGNGDRVVLAAKAGRDISEVPEPFQDVVRWCARHLDDEREGRIAAWPLTLRTRVEGLGEVLFCHATPRSDTQIFTKLTAENRLRPLFDPLEVSVIVCGHTHMPFDRRVGNTRVVNAGSVGMPFGAPGAYWALLGPGLELRRTEYDLRQAADRVRATPYPRAEEFAARNIIAPPSEEEMLQAFARAELR